ncbi:MAG: hypothetical protein K2N78_01495 [Oscillospiraceae bacterium]|nr:hypothetical protein [Oscillospiraceae bacterium]
MNKRIRKNHSKKAVCELLAFCGNQEIMRDLILRKALADVVDAYGRSPEEFSAAFRRYMRAVWLLSPDSPPPRSLRE